ncbi:MAG: caspase family protein [Chitinophagaceae bacterium]
MSVDHANTKVLLIGVSEFPYDPSISTIPNVLANVNKLKQILSDPELVGIPPSNIILSLNEDKISIERKLRNIAISTNDKDSTLLVYYTGHGILNPADFEMYFTTHHTSRKDIDIDGLSPESFRKHIGRSKAARKIIILDCCHSGAFIDNKGTMGDMPSAIQVSLNNFEGTYVMTSAAEDEPALFPEHQPEEPTYFTGKLIDILQNGIDNDHRFSSLRDIFDKIDRDFQDADLPRPQQSNFNNADQMQICVNKRYRPPKDKAEIAWEETLKKNMLWTYVDFNEEYPYSRFSNLAKQKIHELEEEEEWNNALNTANASSFITYKSKYPQGKHVDEANAKLNELRAQADMQVENRFWTDVANKNELAGYREYLQKYPHGKYVEKARNAIDLAVQKLEQDKQLAIQQEAQRKKHQEAQEKKLREAEIEKRKIAELQAQRDRETAAKMQRDKEYHLQQEQLALEEETRRKREQEARRKKDIDEQNKAELEARKKLEEEARKSRELEEQKKMQRESQLERQEELELEEQRKLQRRKQGNMILEETTFVSPSPILGRSKVLIAIGIAVLVILLIILRINGSI